MGQVNIEINNENHKKLKVVCALKDTTIIEYINQALKEKIKKEKI